MNRGGRLQKGQELKSQNGKFTARIEQDGYFRVYYFDYVLWRIDSPVDRIEMQTDGNLVIYGAKNTTLLEPNTRGKGDYAVLHDNGYLAVYYVNNDHTWFYGSIFCKTAGVYDSSLKTIL